MLRFRIAAWFLALSFWAAAPAFAQPPIPPAAPVVAGSGSVAAISGSSTRTAFPKSSVAYPVITALNNGSQDAFCAFGDVTVVATTSSVLVPAGHSIPFYVADPSNPGVIAYIACITANNSTTVAFYQANGAINLGGTSTGGTTAIYGSNYANGVVIINPNTGNPYLPTDSVLTQAPNAATLTEADVPVTGTATQIFTSSATAKYRNVQNIDTTTAVYCGDSAVTTSNGHLLGIASAATQGGGEWTLAPSMFTGGIYCITTSATAHVRAVAW